MDFLSIKPQKYQKNNHAIILKPHLDLRDSKDIIIKGGGLFAIYDESKKIWVTDEAKMMAVMDRAWRKLFAAKVKEIEESNKYLSATEKKYIVSDVEFENYTSDCGYFKNLKNFANDVQNYNNEIDLNAKVIFKNMDVQKEDYSTGKLPYNLEEGSTECWDQLVGYLYEPEEQEKIEWMIGSIVSGFSTKIQKFFVFYGKPGSGKGTIMKIVEAMFKPYYAPFIAKRVVSNSSFPLECLAMNPLVAIDEDGDLSEVQDNTRLNSIVSHETIPVETKFKNPYPVTFKTLLLLSSNEPVKITKGYSGFTRRLIDINPIGSDEPIPQNEYEILFNRITKYERGAIAYKCLQVFNKLGKTYFNNYKPSEMFSQTNQFFQFLEENVDIFKKQNCTYLEQAWRMYKIYVEDSGIKQFMKKVEVREELKNYFEEYYYETKIDDDNRNHYHVYKGFITKQFDEVKKKATKVKKPRKNVVINKDYAEENDIHIDTVDDDIVNWLKFDKSYGDCESKLDIYLKDEKAQYATKDGIPGKRWDNVTTTLKDIDTSKLHYVQAPEQMIVVDFDKKNDKGEKDYELNLKEANKFPRTYAELSKSGAGIHLHYLYSGDISELSRIFGDDIEIKIFTGNASLRRQLTKFNDEEIAKISDGLPLKEKKGGKMLDQSALQTEQMMRRTIIKCLRNEIHGHHKPNMDFIYKITEDAYNNGVHFDLTDMYNDILTYAMASSNSSEYCLELLAKIHLKSDEPSEAVDNYEDEAKIVFFDVEVWPNLFIFGYKFLGGERHILLNPKPHEIEFLINNPQIRLVGFNCRKYDNHIVYAFINGYTNEQLYRLSQKIVSSKKGERDNGTFGEAYNLSYTDIYDFSKKKQSLKKWEIELGIYHKEMDADWNQPLPEDKWQAAAEYNGYDLDATEALWLSKGIQVDFTSRLILADIANGTPNDTDNTLTERLILGTNYQERKAAKNSFHYRNLAEPVYQLEPDQEEFLKDIFPEMMAETHGEAHSLLPYFPGYTFDKYKKLSVYKNEEIGEGGLVRAVPGVYGYAKTFDVTSMHPHSLAAEYYFGKYTEGYYNLVRARIAIKHNNMEFLGKLFEGKLLKYCTDDDQKKKLSTALKTPINAVYGLTAAAFENNLRHPDNIDNIVAKRGALFMMDLRDAVLAQGYQIFHIKTDSLKVINPDEYIENFILAFGKRYGYSFEVEHEFEKICLVNDAVYIAKVTENDSDWKKEAKKAAEEGKPEPTRWTATGAQFQIPYVFKTLFSKEPITFDDVCMIKNVSKGALYLDYNEGLDDVSKYEEFKDILDDAASGIDIDKKYTKKANAELKEFLITYSEEDLDNIIASGHSRQFIGKVGNFCPMQVGYGGAELVCLNEQGKYVSPSGCKDIRWMEAEYVKAHHLEDKINYDYFEKMCQEAINDISRYGGTDMFFE